MRHLMPNRVLNPMNGDTFTTENGALYTYWEGVWERTLTELEKRLNDIEARLTALEKE
jgi:hypothetical protein